MIYDMRLVPRTLNLSSNGVFHAQFSLPDGYSKSDINMGTVFCHGAYATKISGNVNIKFERQDLLEVETGDEVMLTVTGQFNDGTPFEGFDVIRVIDNGN